MNGASHLLKGAVCGLCIAGAAYFFTRTIVLPIEIAVNFRNLLNGTYTVPEVSDALFYSFNAYAVGSMILFSVFPDRKENLLP